MDDIISFYRANMLKAWETEIAGWQWGRWMGNTEAAGRCKQQQTANTEPALPCVSSGPHPTRRGDSLANLSHWLIKRDQKKGVRVSMNEWERESSSSWCLIISQHKDQWIGLSISTSNCNSQYMKMTKVKKRSEQHLPVMLWQLMLHCLSTRGNSATYLLATFLEQTGRTWTNLKNECLLFKYLS